ncbi:MAG: hypothetical protein DCC67_19185, partial [Planctomycetota bacterium]
MSATPLASPLPSLLEAADEAPAYVAAAALAEEELPQLGVVTDKTTPAGAPITFTLTSTDPTGGGVAYRVVDPTTLAAPANVTVTINQATGEVTLTPAASFAGTINLLAGVRAAAAADAPENYDTAEFTLTVTPAASGKPVLGAVANQTTTAGTPVTLTLSATSPGAGGVVYSVVDAATLVQPANVTVVVNQATGQVTLTPAAAFSGAISLLARVRNALAPDQADSYSTQTFTLTVTSTPAPAAPTNLAIVASAGAGPFDGNGYTSVLPTLSLTAPSGATVEIKRGGSTIATATETAAGSGQYRVTLPAGSLAVGLNEVTAVARNSSGASGDSPPLAITYAPSAAGGVYTVPGAPGAAQALAFAWISENAAFENELGLVVVSGSDGSVGGVAPGSAGYAQALLGHSSRRVIFAKGQGAGAESTIVLAAGQSVVFYLVQNNTTAALLASNPTNAPQGNDNPSAPVAFFSVPAANPDGRRHAQIVADPTTEQQVALARHAGAARFAFNQCLRTVKTSLAARRH